MTMQRTGNTYVYDIWIPKDNRYREQERATHQSLGAFEDEDGDESEEENESDFSRLGDELL